MKYKELNAIFNEELPEITIKQVILDIPELQGEPKDILLNKLKFARSKQNGPLIVEDTSLCYNALNGLPGPYNKDFLTKLGNDGLYKLISAYEDKTGYAQCIIGLITKDDHMLFIGRTDGIIVPPRGNVKFGWDPIFQPNDFNQTYAEMDKAIKNKISHRYKAVRGMINWLKANPYYI
jgi:inosine triphosphate pyrophosphatase